MRLFHARTAPYLMVALAALLGSSVARADCLENFYQCNGHVFSSFEPRASMECLGEPQNQIGRASLSYDLVSGRFTSFSGGLEFGAGAGITCSDHYDVIGPPDAGCSDVFRVELHVMAHFMKSQFGGQGDVSASIRLNGSGPRLFVVPKATATIDTVVTMELTRCGGTGFDLEIGLHTGASGGSCTASAQFAITDLDPSLVIVSCQGFRSEQPVPALPATWGGLKARYR